MVNFLFVAIELFPYLLRLRRYKRKSVEVAVFQRGWVTLSKFQTEGASPTNHCWCQKAIVIDLSCGIKMSVHCLVLSQSSRVTDRQTDGQNYDSQDRASIAASRGKNGKTCACLFFVSLLSCVYIRYYWFITHYIWNWMNKHFEQPHSRNVISVIRLLGRPT